MKFILIVIVKYMGEGVAVSSAEFNNEKACVAAKIHIEANSPSLTWISAHCYAKGSQ